MISIHQLSSTLLLDILVFSHPSLSSSTSLLTHILHCPKSHIISPPLTPYAQPSVCVQILHASSPTALQQQHTQSSPKSAWLHLISYFSRSPPVKPHHDFKKKKSLTFSISRITRPQDTNLYITKERAISAQARDIRVCASAIDKVVFEACYCAGGETGKVLREDGSCCCKEGDES
jgi:hypothetical protein